MILHCDMDAYYASVEERETQSRVDAVADEIKERFGSGSLRRGSRFGREG